MQPDPRYMQIIFWLCEPKTDCNPYFMQYFCVETMRSCELFSIPWMLCSKRWKITIGHLPQKSSEKSDFAEKSELMVQNTRLGLYTRSWLCFTPVTRTRTKTTRTTRTTHQSLSEGGVLEGWNLTHRLLMGFWLSSWGNGPCHKRNKNNNTKKNFQAQNFF